MLKKEDKDEKNINSVIFTLFSLIIFKIKSISKTLNDIFYQLYEKIVNLKPFKLYIQENLF